MNTCKFGAIGVPLDECPICHGDHDRISRRDWDGCGGDCGPCPGRELEQEQIPSHEAEAREYALEQHLKAADAKRAAGVVQGGEATQGEAMLGRNGRGRRRGA